MHSYEQLTELLDGQTHVLRFWNELSDVQKEKLASQIVNMDVSRSIAHFEESAIIHKASSEDLQPIPSSNRAVLADMDHNTQDRYLKAGLKAIANGEVAALVLAGGQASRLGSSSPKGTIPLGLNIAPEDSLLGIQAAKIAALEALARKEYPDSDGRIQWIVMTSRTTNEPTMDHLKKIVPAAGLTLQQITVFSQSEIPAFDMEGKLILSDKDTIFTAPNGNGGIYSALAPHLDSLRLRGVKYFHTYCIDNILCKVADPRFIGYAAETGADVLTKTVLKHPGELVGSVCLEKGVPRVTEYSELGPELASRTAPDGRFLFGDGSIANHLFTMDFLRRFCTPSFNLQYHRAEKKIAFVDAEGQLVKPEKPNGIKLEQFIFDVFPMSTNFHLWEVSRQEEFSPLKNAESAGVDCLSTCREAICQQSMRWLKSAGAVIRSSPVYVHASRSYDGEGLDGVEGREVEGVVV